MEIKSEEKIINVITKEGEKSSQTLWLERMPFRVALIGIFNALAVVLGYALVIIPNIELFTLMIFLAGFIMGKRDGVFIGLMSSFIFSFFNPFGAAPLPLFAYQLVHYALVGFLGGVMSTFMSKRDFFKPEDDLYVFPLLLIFAITAAVITFIYDVISTLIGALVIYGTFESFWPSYLIGLPFTTVHLIGNTLGFIFILPALIQLIYKMLDISEFKKESNI